jgi:hypothetical protein
MTHDNHVLATRPGLFKATPQLDGERRLVVIEPSKEVVDLEGELILQRALYRSREYFLQKGNLDVDHMSWIGYERGVTDQDYYDIGRPIEVKGTPDRVVVLGEIARGTEMADKVWRRMTEREPPIRYYPSIGAHRERAHPKRIEGREALETSQVRWVNIAFCKEPVNPEVAPIEVCEPAVVAKAIVTGVREIHGPLLARATALVLKTGCAQSLAPLARAYGLSIKETDLLMNRVREAIGA